MEIDIDLKKGIDWRVWLPYWKNFTQEEQDLLDLVAQVLLEPVGFDKYEKYVNMVRTAYKENMITKGEYSALSNLYKVCNP
jgi:hypothetical protein